MCRRTPLDLLVSQRFKDVLRHLQPQLDFIIIDTPPVELVSDAVAIAPMATSTIYVRATETPVPVIRKGMNRLQRSGANIMGVIVNGLDFDEHSATTASLSTVVTATPTTTAILSNPKPETDRTHVRSARTRPAGHR